MGRPLCVWPVNPSSNEVFACPQGRPQWEWPVNPSSKEVEFEVFAWVGRCGSGLSIHPAMRCSLVLKAF